MVTRDQILKIIGDIENIFSNDDVHSASRGTLELAVLIAHDGLNALLEMVED